MATITPKNLRSKKKVSNLKDSLSSLLPPTPESRNISSEKKFASGKETTTENETLSLSQLLDSKRQRETTPTPTPLNQTASERFAHLVKKTKVEIRISNKTKDGEFLDKEIDEQNFPPNNINDTDDYKRNQSISSPIGKELKTPEKPRPAPTTPPRSASRPLHTSSSGSSIDRTPQKLLTPRKDGTPQKLLLSPYKIKRDAIDNIESFSKSHQKLILLFEALEQACSFAEASRKTTLFHSLKKIVENQVGFAFNLHHLSQIVYLFPKAYKLEPIDFFSRDEGRKIPSLEVERSLEKGYTEDLTIDYARRYEFRENLLDFIFFSLFIVFEKKKLVSDSNFFQNELHARNKNCCQKPTLFFLVS